MVRATELFSTHDVVLVGFLGNIYYIISCIIASTTTTSTTTTSITTTATTTAITIAKYYYCFSSNKLKTSFTAQNFQNPVFQLIARF